jgi:hypothetical protein
MGNESTESPRLKHWELKLVRSVARAYARMRCLPTMIAQNVDDSPGARSMRWNPDSAHFVIDTQKALTAVLENQPDRLALIKAWARIVIDDSVIRETESRLISLVAPVFQARGLDPAIYFRHIKQGRLDRRDT